MIEAGAKPTAAEWPAIGAPDANVRRHAKARPEVIVARLDACRVCPFMVKDGDWLTCPACKCTTAMDIKALIERETCPKGRWKA